MAVGRRTFDDDGVLAGWQRGAAFEECAEPFDEVGRPVREVEQGALLDLAVDPIALAQQNGGRGGGLETTLMYKTTYITLLDAKQDKNINLHGYILGSERKLIAQNQALERGNRGKFRLIRSVRSRFS